MAADNQTILATVNEVLEILKRIEERQIRTTGMVQEMEQAAPPVVGSFASSDLGKKD